VYDLILTSSPPEHVRRQFPTMRVRRVGTQTALRREVSGPDQVGDLLDALGEMRLPLVDLHLLPATTGTGTGATYEVHVDGELGEPVLRYLSWSHHVVPAHVRVLIRAGARELAEFLLACSESGAGIERVRRVTARDPRRTA